MQPAATEHDFKQLPLEQQRKFEALLRHLEQHRISCRVHMAGREMQIVIANGLSMPKYWLDRFGFNH